MKASEFRKLIREEVRKVMSEATLISKGSQSGAPAEIKFNDYVRWYKVENERGMSRTAGTYIGKVVKILGSRNLQVEVESPRAEAGDVYKVDKEECQRVPRVGEKISAKVGFDKGFGSGSQGTVNVMGVVTKVDIANQIISMKSEEGKLMNAKISDLSDINILA